VNTIRGRRWSQDLKPDEAFDKFRLFEKISIENWILPGAYAGVFSTIVWVCPVWSSQIPPGEYTFQIGCHKVRIATHGSVW
jgi:hypothetical protein